MTHTHLRRGRLCAGPDELCALRAVWASYVGHFSHAASGQLQTRLHREFPWLKRALTKAP